MNEITHYTELEEYPSSLKAADQICESVSIDLERLLSLAENGIIPHWRIDGGAPLFKISEVKRFIAKNLMFRCEGSEVPVNIKISPLAPIANNEEAPVEIREICGLRKIPQGDYAPCVYFLCKDSKVVYVGQSISVASRISTHKHSKDFDEVYLVHTPSAMLNAVESALIRHLKPELNGPPPVRDDSQDKEILSKVISGQ